MKEETPGYKNSKVPTISETVERMTVTLRNPNRDIYYNSEALGYLLSFLAATKANLDIKFKAIKSTLNMDKYLQDIDYLPMAYIDARFPLPYFLNYHYPHMPSKKEENEAYQKWMSEMQFLDDLPYGKANLCHFYDRVDNIDSKDLVQYLKRYAQAKKADVYMIDQLIIAANKTEKAKEISDWLKIAREEIMIGILNGQEPRVLQYPAYIVYKKSWIIDGLRNVLFTKSFKSINQLVIERDRLRKRNDELQDLRIKDKPECERWFTGLDEISRQGGYNPNKVGIKVEYKPWEPIDPMQIDDGRYMATKIYITYAGVNDQGECKELSIYDTNEIRIRNAEKKLLVQLAFYADNPGKLRDLLDKCDRAIVGHLNVMFKTIFALTGRSEFIDKGNALIKVKLRLKQTRTF